MEVAVKEVPLRVYYGFDITYILEFELKLSLVRSELHLQKATFTSGIGINGVHYWSAITDANVNATLTQY